MSFLYDCKRNNTEIDKLTSKHIIDFIEKELEWIGVEKIGMKCMIGEKMTDPTQQARSVYTNGTLDSLSRREKHR